jgi:hypothetical protein
MRLRTDTQPAENIARTTNSLTNALIQNARGVGTAKQACKPYAIGVRRSSALWLLILASHIPSSTERKVWYRRQRRYKPY